MRYVAVRLSAGKYVPFGWAGAGAVVSADGRVMDYVWVEFRGGAVEYFHPAGIDRLGRVYSSPSEMMGDSSSTCHEFESTRELEEALDAGTFEEKYGVPAEVARELLNPERGIWLTDEHISVFTEIYRMYYAPR